MEVQIQHVEESLYVSFLQLFFQQTFHSKLGSVDWREVFSWDQLYELRKIFDQGGHGFVFLFLSWDLTSRGLLLILFFPKDILSLHLHTSFWQYLKSLILSQGSKLFSGDPKENQSKWDYTILNILTWSILQHLAWEQPFHHLISRLLEELLLQDWVKVFSVTIQRPSRKLMRFWNFDQWVI